MIKRWAFIQICLVVMVLFGGAGESNASGCSKNNINECNDTEVCKLATKNSIMTFMLLANKEAKKEVCLVWVKGQILRLSCGLP